MERLLRKVLRIDTACHAALAGECLLLPPKGWRGDCVRGPGFNSHDPREGLLALDRGQATALPDQLLEFPWLQGAQLPLWGLPVRVRKKARAVRTFYLDGAALPCHSSAASWSPTPSSTTWARDAAIHHPVVPASRGSRAFGEWCTYKAQ